MQSSGDRKKVDTARWNACALCKACAELYPRMRLALLQLLLIGVHCPYLESLHAIGIGCPSKAFCCKAEQKERS